MSNPSMELLVNDETGEILIPEGSGINDAQARYLVKKQAEQQAAQQPVEGNFLYSAGRGVASGLLQMGEAANILTEAVGRTVGSKQLESYGTFGKEYLSSIRQARFRMNDSDRTMQERYKEEGWAGVAKNLVDPTYMAYNIGQIVPSLLVTASGYGAGMQAVGALGLTGRAAVAARTAVGIVAYGATEAPSTYDDVYKATGDNGKALLSLGAMSIAGGILNTAGFDTAMGKMADEGVLLLFGKKALEQAGRIKRGVVGGIAEASTEYAEEVADVLVQSAGGAITREEALQKLKDGFEVIAPSFILGAGGGAVSGDSERGKPNTTQEGNAALLDTQMRYVSEADPEDLSPAVADDIVAKINAERQTKGERPLTKFEVSRLVTQSDVSEEHKNAFAGAVFFNKNKYVDELGEQLANNVITAADVMYNISKLNLSPAEARKAHKKLAGISFDIPQTYSEFLKGYREQKQAEQQASVAKTILESAPELQNISAKEAYDRLNAAYAFSLSEDEKMDLTEGAQSKGTSFADIVDYLKTRRGDVTLKKNDLGFLQETFATIKKRQKKKSQFTTETEVEMYLRDKGVRFEGDAPADVFSPETIDKLRLMFPEATDQEFAVHVAWFGRMVQNVVPESVSPDVFVKTYLQGLEVSPDKVVERAVTTQDTEKSAEGLSQASGLKPKLPKVLAGAKPRYQTSEIEFSSDLDKALYIIAQKTPSARNAEYLEFARQYYPGASDIELRRLGEQVKAGIKAEAYKTAPNNPIRFDAMHPNLKGAQNETPTTQTQNPTNTPTEENAPVRNARGQIVVRPKQGQKKDIRRAVPKQERSTGKTTKTVKVLGETVTIDVKTGRSVEFRPVSEHTKYLIRAFNGSNFSTMIHELTHFLVLTAQGEFKATLEKQVGKKLDKWSRNDHEMLARSMEQYLLFGKYKTPGELLHLQWLKQNMHKAYETSLETIRGEISPELVIAAETLFFGANMSEVVSNVELFTGLTPSAHKLEATYKDLPNVTLKGEQSAKWKTLIFRSDTYLNSPAAIREVIAAHKKGIRIPADAIAAMGMLDAMFDEQIDLMIDKNVSEEDMIEFAAMIDEIREVYRESGSYAARNLTARSMISHKTKVLSLMQQMQGQFSQAEIAAIHKAIERGDAVELARLQEKLTEKKDEVTSKKIKRAILALYYNSMLSSPRTWGVNIVSNSAWLTFLSFDRPLQAAIDKFYSKVIPGYKRKEIPGVASAMLGQLMQAPVNRRAWKTAKQGFLKGYTDDPHTQTRYEEELALAFEGENPIQFLVRNKKLANTLNLPFRVLFASDLWFKAIAEDQVLKSVDANLAAAIKQGRETEYKMNFLRENLKILRMPDKVKDDYNKLFDSNAAVRKDGDIANLTTEQIMENLDSYYAMAVENAMAVYAEYATFQDPNGAIGRAVTMLRNGIPFGLGRVFFPFVRTLSNIADRGVEMLPGLGAAYAYGEGRHLAHITASQIEGALIALAFYGLYTAGRLTGPPPEDPREKAMFYREGKRPWSILIGDGYVDYRYLDPFGLPLGILTAEMQRFEQIAAAGDEVTQAQAFTQLAQTAKDAFLELTYMKNVAHMFGASDTDLYRQLGWTGSTVIPFSSLVRSVKNSYEAATTGTIKSQEATIGNMFGKSIPLPEKTLVDMGIVTLDDRMDAYGRPMVRKSSFLLEWSPFRYSPTANDIVDQQLKAVEMYPKFPSRRMTVWTGKGEVSLDDADYEQYAIAYGQAQYNALKKLFEGQHYKKLTSMAAKQALVEATIEANIETVRNRFKAQLRRQKKYQEWKVQ